MSTAAAPIVDAGAPYEHGTEPAQGAPTTPQKSDIEKRLDALDAELKSERALRKEAEDNAKYWAEHGRSAAVIEPEPESEDEPIEDDPAGNDEALLDDIAKQGRDALKKRGFVTAAEVKRLVREAEQRAMGAVEQRDAEGAFERQLASEFPELVEDSRRQSKGEQPKTELWARTREIYREAVALDPALKSSKSALIIAARQAKAELSKAKPAGKGAAAAEEEEEAEPTPSRGARRRARIQSQAPEPRRASGAGDDEDGPVVTEEARQVMKHLGVKEEEYVKRSNGGKRG